MEGIPPGLVVETDALQNAPWYRREPYLVFFPLGIVLSWCGVTHWLLHALGYLDDYRPIFHAMTQIQGFMTAFAVGFLFTMIPRRTGSQPPTTGQVVICATATCVVVGAAWNQAWMISQTAWIVVAITLIVFAVQRFRTATSTRKPPRTFIWIPFALAAGICGSALTAIGAAGGEELFWLHNVGRGLVLQGMFTGLVLGVGGLAFPLMTRGRATNDITSWVQPAAHACAALVLMSSFFVEALVSLRLAVSMRFVITLGVLLIGAELWRKPDQPGANRRLIWWAGWCLPLGYLIAAIEPAYYKGALHVVFLGGFALLAFGVSTQVTLGHRGYRDTMLGNPWQVPTIGTLMAAAMLARLAMEIDRVRYFQWMGVAAVMFLGATAVWLQFLAPKMWKARAEPSS